jgi:hypothetical protein
MMDAEQQLKRFLVGAVSSPIPAMYQGNVETVDQNEPNAERSG